MLSDNESATRALVLHPVIGSSGQRRPVARSPEAMLAEIVGLAAAIRLEIVHADLVRLAKVRPATLLGTGKIDDLAKLTAALEVELAVVDTALTPVQQRNLERALKVKVIDRTGLILEIFGDRARTREGRLQVELAHLTYQRSRLVRSWTHLERQRGGAGFMGGPGESQIEIDRRLIDDRIARLRRELETVTRTRQLHRAKRQKVPYPIVALVGYTNAGKSTLFNRLTEADVFADDLLFATLDPTMRSVILPGGTKVILSDTVGFVSNLPTHLIAAFRATLEEVLEADLLLHVRDVSHPDSDAQTQDVEEVLRQLWESDAREPQPTIIVNNKIDLLPHSESLSEYTDRPELNGHPEEISVSAQTGDGVSRLLAAIERRLNKHREIVDVVVDHGDGAMLAWLYRHGDVLERVDEESSARLTVGLMPQELGRFRKLYSAPS